MLESLGRLESRARGDGAGKVSCPTGCFPMSPGIGQLSSGLSPCRGIVTLPRVSSRERAAKPGRERRSLVRMISFHKEKGEKKESITFKSVLSKSCCLPLALLCWPFLAERDLGSALAKPGSVCCQLLGSFPEILSFVGKRVLGLGSQF